MSFIFSLLQDFSIYYHAATYFLAGQNPYQPQLLDGFIYPPSSLIIFSPFSLLPIELARPIWTILSLSALYLSIHLLIKRPIIRITAFALLITLFFPVKFTLGMGQINLFVLLGLVSSFYYSKTKPTLAGVILGFTAGLKFIPLLLLFYYLFYRRYRLVISALLTFVALNLFVDFLSPQPLITNYLSLITNYSHIAYTYYNQSLSGVLANHPDLRYFFSTLIFILTLLKLKKLPLDLHSFSLFITFLLLLSPVSWQHHFVWLIPSFVLTLKKPTLTAIISLLLVAINLPNPHLLVYPLYYHATLGTLLLWLYLINAPRSSL